jgi:LmbE family N-acetylglucosaminyl deacetylase
MATPLRRLILGSLIGLAALTLPASRAQLRVTPLDDSRGHVALGLALRHLGNTGIFMHATAHPDDENNALLVMLNRGLGFRTALATATRGDGGQNEIGPEISEALGVLRTEELAAMHRFDGAEQYFTRAVDFGFSFSIEETFEKWGRDEITADYVRLIRMIRPDVIVGLRPDGAGGGQHHQASTVISRDAFKAAGDPTRYPEQIKAGLQPWQPRKYYYTRFGGPADASGKVVSVNLATYDPLIGRTYIEIGADARSMHKCQGMGQTLALPGPATSSFELVESTIAGQAGKPEQALFDGIDYSIGGLARFAGARPARELTQALTAVSTAVQNAQKAFQTAGDQATLAPLLTGLRAVRSARAVLQRLSIDEAGKFEIEFRLRQKEREFQQAIVIAAGVQVDAIADDPVVVPGQPVKVSLIVANHGATEVKVKEAGFEGFSGDRTCTLTARTVSAGFMGGRGRGGAPPVGPPLSVLRKDQVTHCEPTLTISPDARITEPYWHRAGEAGRYTFDEDAPFGLPYRPTEFYAQATLTFGTDAEVVYHALPVQYRSGADIFTGEKRGELLVVPAVSVRVSPTVNILPLGSVAAVAPPPPPPAPPAARGRGAGRGSGPTGRGAAPMGRGAGRGRASAPDPPSPPAPPPVVDDRREVRVLVTNATRGEAEVAIALSLPTGWTASPPQQTVSFAREDEERTIRFQLRPAPGTPAGEYGVAVSGSRQGQTFERGFQVIEYPHTRRQHIYEPASTTIRIIDVKIAPNLTVGYIMGVGDQVPAAIDQLGAKVEMIGPDELAWGDLSRYNAIVAGVRAYERRADLRAHNARLLDYVRDGGTFIVQYNKFEFNEAQYAPFPAKVTVDRITDEHAPVQIVNPSDPLFTGPNRITDAAWQGWVQERGLYFLAPEDSRYREHIVIVDPFPNNPGEKRGALVSAAHGKGRWTYVGLGLWRELPAGVPGAYQLLANLLSQKGS